jgi:hypothetical protein
VDLRRPGERGRPGRGGRGSGGRPSGCSRRRSGYSRRPSGCSRRRSRCSRRPSRCSRRPSRCSRRPSRCSRRPSRCSRRPSRCSRRRFRCSRRRSRCSGRLPGRCVRPGARHWRGDSALGSGQARRAVQGRALLAGCVGRLVRLGTVEVGRVEGAGLIGIRRSEGVRRVVVLRRRVRVGGGVGGAVRPGRVGIRRQPGRAVAPRRRVLAALVLRRACGTARLGDGILRRRISWLTSGARAAVRSARPVRAERIVAAVGAGRACPARREVTRLGRAVDRAVRIRCCAVRIGPGGRVRGLLGATLAGSRLLSPRRRGRGSVLDRGWQASVLLRPLYVRALADCLQLSRRGWRGLRVRRGALADCLQLSRRG